MSHLNRLKYVWIALIVVVLLVGGFVFTERYIEYKKNISESHVVDQSTSSSTGIGGGATAGLQSRPVSSTGSDDVRYVRVSNVEDLLAAIGSNTVINLEPGTYDLTEYLSKLWAEDSQSSKRVHHSFGYLRGSYDEPELVIWPVVNLTIRGASDHPGDTFITTGFEHANLLTFSHCQNITLSHLSIGGHLPEDVYLEDYEPVDTGSAVCFDTCTDVTLDQVGLGYYRSYNIKATGAEGTYLFSNCRLFNFGYSDHHDDLFNITNSKAAFLFDGCAFGGTVADNIFASNFPTAEMKFMNCRFDGEWNYKTWMDRDNVFFENCTDFYGSVFSTDLAARADRFDPSAYWTSVFTADDLAGSKWHGILIQYTDTAASTALPWTDPDTGFVYEANVEFNADGTGTFEWYNAPEAGPFLWKMVSVKEASFPGVTVEMFEQPGSSSKVLRLWIENIMIWMEPVE